jgi:hypothetical protein
LARKTKKTDEIKEGWRGCTRGFLATPISPSSKKQKTALPGPAGSAINALPSIRDHTTDQLGPDGDEYILREWDQAGEQKLTSTGQLLSGPEYRCRTFFVPNRGDKLFMLATEYAQVLGYRDSYLLFNKNRSLYKIIATQAEKEDLIHKEILPFAYRSRQIAIVTAKSMFRQFGSRVIVNGRRVHDDYWEAKAREQGFMDDDLAGKKRPGAAKAKDAALAEANANATEPTEAASPIVKREPLSHNSNSSMSGRDWPFQANSNSTSSPLDEAYPLYSQPGASQPMVVRNLPALGCPGDIIYSSSPGHFGNPPPQSETPPPEQNGHPTPVQQIVNSPPFQRRGGLSAPPLPNGWIAHRDRNSGQIYYTHFPTQATQWEFPKGPTPLNHDLAPVPPALSTYGNLSASPGLSALSNTPLDSLHIRPGKTTPNEEYRNKLTLNGVVCMEILIVVGHQGLKGHPHCLSYKARVKQIIYHPGRMQPPAQGKTRIKPSPRLLSSSTSVALPNLRNRHRTSMRLI